MAHSPIPFDFRARRPALPVARIVESIWYARGTVPYSTEWIAPTGSTVAVFVLGDPILQTPFEGGSALCATSGFLVGPHDRPAINEPTGETFAVGIVTTPIGCRAVFGVDPAPLRGRVVDLLGVWLNAAPLLRELLATSEPDEMLRTVEARIATKILPARPRLDRCEYVVEALERDPTRPIQDIATEIGVTHSHLDREFVRLVGLSPRVLARLLRMRRLLESIDVHGEVGWSDRAAELGWFDQAHLIRDFKRHTGVTPTRYLAAQRAAAAAVQGGDTAGFVPDDQIHPIPRPYGQGRLASPSNERAEVST